MDTNSKFSRRDFLKLSGMAALAFSVPPSIYSARQKQDFYPDGVNLGRICQGDPGSPTDIKSEPSMEAPTIATAFFDDVIEVKREVVASKLDLNRYDQRWVETSQGYIFNQYVQPVHNKINQPLTELPKGPDGQPGLWVEITVPWARLIMANTPGSYWLKNTADPKVYFGSVYYTSQIRQNNGVTEYGLTQLYGAAPDVFWVDARACRPITAEEIAPIRPDVGDKLVKIYLDYQTMSCYEGKNEVYYCDVSTGPRKDDTWVTPLGTHIIWRKMLSVHMSAGGMSAFDSPGIAWPVFFDSHGAAIHTAYWHNSFGTPVSHGCVNCRPEDAKFVWRWTNPVIDYYPGELTVSGGANSTRIEVIGS